MFNPFLTFSDSAKYAEAAKNLLTQNDFVVHHSFFDPNVLANFQPGQAFHIYFLPLVPRLLSFFFRFLPANDQTMALIGSIGLVIIWTLVFLIAKKLHSFKAGLISLVLMITSLFFWEYARNATTEIFFTIEILLFVYLLLFNKFSRLAALIPLFLMFATRQQAIIVLGAALLTGLLYFVFSHFSLKAKLNGLFILISVSVLAIVFSIRNPNSIFSPMKVVGALNIATNTSQGIYLRGGAYTFAGPKILLSKVFYNSYNYLKNPERLAYPSVFFLFILGIFLVYKNIQIKWFYVFSAFLLSLMIFGASATLPNARYVHPVIPLVYIAAGISFAQILTNLKQKHKNIALALTLFLLTLPTIGYFTLDARFRQQQFNVNKPPVYKVISDIMYANIPQNKLIITNLDAWAAWYHSLTTMWFPISPELLQKYSTPMNKVDYIVITNYLENDADFELGPWKEVVYNPDKIQNSFLKDNYRVLKTFTISANETYEKQEYRGTILVKRDLQ